MAYLDLGRAVRGVEFLLRQRRGIEEFTDDPDCLFRISLETAGVDLMLSDGILLREGDQVIHLHFWNEHLPAMPEGPSTGWANLMKRRMRHSLTTLAGYLESEGSLDAVRALTGWPPFASRVGALQMVRTAERFGFEVIDADVPLEWRGRLHAVLDSMFLWGLAYAYNPGRLKVHRGLMRHRYQLWISRQKLLRCYGLASAAEPQ